MSKKLLQYNYTKYDTINKAHSFPQHEEFQTEPENGASFAVEFKVFQRFRVALCKFINLHITLH